MSLKRNTKTLKKRLLTLTRLAMTLLARNSTSKRRKCVNRLRLPKWRQRNSTKLSKISTPPVLMTCGEYHSNCKTRSRNLHQAHKSSSTSRSSSSRLILALRHSNRVSRALWRKRNVQRCRSKACRKVSTAISALYRRA